jgi:hypothetical protein
MRDPQHAWSRRIARISQDPTRIVHWAKWFTSKYTTKVSHELFLEASHDLSASCFVLGSARSGTTWMAEVLSAAQDTRFIMEPFDVRCSQFRDGLPDATYLSPGSHNERLEYFGDRVFSGQLRSQWTDQYNHARRPTRRVVKDVRTVALLGWFLSRYSAMPTVYVLRHPFATAWSMATLGWGTHGSLLAESTRLDRLSETERKILLPQAFLAEVTRWCVEQERGLRHLEPSVRVVFYEDLVASPLGGFSKIAEHLGARSKAWRNWTPDPATFTTPSATSVRRVAPASADEWLASWQGMIDDATIQQALSIIKEFGLDDVYGLASTPNLDADELWKRTR